MRNDIHRANAYSADELVDFLAELDSHIATGDLPVSKQEIARDVVAAVRAAVAEYGLNAPYVAGHGIGREQGQTVRVTGYMPYTVHRIVLDRNRRALADRGTEINEAKAAAVAAALANERNAR